MFDSVLSLRGEEGGKKVSKGQGSTGELKHQPFHVCCGCVFRGTGQKRTKKERSLACISAFLNLTEIWDKCIILYVGNNI